MKYRLKKAILVTSPPGAFASGTMFYNMKPSRRSTTPAQANATQPGVPTSGVAVGSTAATNGYVQVQAVVRNGQIQKVVVLEHPNSSGTSGYINSMAMPCLVNTFERSLREVTLNCALTGSRIAGIRRYYRD